MINYYGQILAQPSVYISDGAILTVATVLSEFPANADRVGMYARVSDLYGSVDEILRCRYDGTNYRWVPQRESFAGTTAATGGTVPLIPLVTPPTLRLTSTTVVTPMNIVPSSANAYIGQRARVIAPSSLSLGSLLMQITGLIGSNITLLAGNTRDIEFGPSGWFQSS